jgi:hypothetical protein
VETFSLSLKKNFSSWRHGPTDFYFDVLSEVSQTNEVEATKIVIVATGADFYWRPICRQNPL